MTIKIPVLLLSTASCILIFTTLSFFIVWLGFPVEKPEDSFKDALDFSGGIFSGATTFGAAVVAGFLFNDWRESQTGINRSELAKNTQLSLYSMVSLCDYYHNLAVVNEHIFNAKTFPGISHEIIAEAEKIPIECSELRIQFKEDFQDLYKKFQLDLRIYEKNFEPNLELNLNIINDYRLSIGGLLRDLSQSKPRIDLLRMKAHMFATRKTFDESIVKVVTNETAQYINIIKQSAK